MLPLATEADLQTAGEILLSRAQADPIRGAMLDFEIAESDEGPYLWFSDVLGRAPYGFMMARSPCSGWALVAGDGNTVLARDRTPPTLASTASLEAVLPALFFLTPPFALLVNPRVVVPFRRAQAA